MNSMSVVTLMTQNNFYDNLIFVLIITFLYIMMHVITFFCHIIIYHDACNNHIYHINTGILRVLMACASSFGAGLSFSL